MILFRSALRQRLNDLIVPVVGPGSDPNEFIRTFDKRLRDVPKEELPLLVINVRMADKLSRGEIGVGFQHYTWTAHVYYLDMEAEEANYDKADERRDHIMAKIEKVLEENNFLQLNNIGLSTTDSDHHTEKVYDTSIQTIIFDESGQEGYYSFASELYLEVYTDRS